MVRLAVNLDAMLQRGVPRGDSPEPWLEDVVGAATLAELGGADAIVFTIAGCVTPDAAEAARRVRDAIATSLCLRVAEPEAAAAALDFEPARLAIDASADVAARSERWTPIVAEARRRGVSVAAGAACDADSPALRACGAAAIEFVVDGRASSRARYENAAVRAREAGLEVGIVADEVEFDAIADFVAIRDVSRIEVGTSLVTRATLVGMARATTELRYLVNRSRSLEPCGRVPSMETGTRSA